MNDILFFLTSGLYLFTSTELLDSTVIEFISNIGVIALLWLWLQDLKKQLKNQLKEFRAESKEAREHCDKTIDRIVELIGKEKDNE